MNDHREVWLKQKRIHPEGGHTTHCGELQELSPIDWKERQTFGSTTKVVRLSSAHFSILLACDLKIYALQILRSKTERSDQVDASVRRGAWREWESLNVIRTIKEEGA